MDDSKPYDPNKWGAYYRPYGVDAPAGAVQVTESNSAPSKKVSVDGHGDVHETEEEPVKASEPVVVPKSTSSDKAQDILAMIRARQQKA